MKQIKLIFSLAMLLCTRADIVKGASGCTTVYFTQSPTICFGASFSVGNNTYTTSNTYTDTLSTFINGCDSIVTTELTVQNAINALATAVYPTCACPGYLYANDTGASYQWVNCNLGYALIPGQNNQVFNFSSAGSYAVIITDGGCTDTSDCVSVIYTGIDDIKPNLAKVELFPNPANSELTIVLERTDEAPIEISISNILGQTMNDLTSTLVNSNSHSIPTSNLADGVYLLRLKRSSETAIQYFVVKH